MTQLLKKQKGQKYFTAWTWLFPIFCNTCKKATVQCTERFQKKIKNSQGNTHIAFVTRNENHCADLSSGSGCILTNRSCQTEGELTVFLLPTFWGHQVHMFSLNVSYHLPLKNVVFFAHFSTCQRAGDRQQIGLQSCATDNPLTSFTSPQKSNVSFSQISIY